MRKLDTNLSKKVGYSDYICSICGIIKNCRKSHVNSKNILSCGCATSLKIHGDDFTGKYINGVHVYGFESNGFWRVLLSCGHMVRMKTWNIKNVPSINCKKCNNLNQRNILIERNTSHSLSKTTTYSSWLNMKKRCYDIKSNRYSYYGGKGIKVCDRWLDSFENFLDDMGECPIGFSIERIDIDKCYEIGNCYWADNITQANNIKISNGNEIKSLRYWCRVENKDYKKCHYMLKKKEMKIEDILGEGYTLM